MKNLFYTHSTNLCAYLLMEGHEVVGKQRNGNKITFYFERSPELNLSIDKYNNDENIKLFISNFKKVKEIIRNT